MVFFTSETCNQSAPLDSFFIAEGGALVCPRPKDKIHETCRQDAQMYRASGKSLYVVARNVFLLLLN